MVNREKPTEKAPPAAPNQQARGAQDSSAADHRVRRTPTDSALPFFRVILWVLVYGFSVLLLMSLIILRFRIQTIIIGAALLVCAALLAGTYALQWRRR